MNHMNDQKSKNPSEIVEYLLQEMGPKNAIQATHDGISDAQTNGDNYALSIWREVKGLLKAQYDK
jgi:hypothetical protein